MNKINLKDIIIFTHKQSIPVYVKRLKTKDRNQIETITILGGFFAVLSSLKNLLATQSFLDPNEELLELIYNQTHIILYKKETHTLIGFFKNSITNQDKNLIEEINTKFSSTFSDTLQNWDREISIFKSFDSELQKIIEKYKSKNINNF